MPLRRGNASTITRSDVASLASIGVVTQIEHEPTLDRIVVRINLTHADSLSQSWQRGRTRVPRYLFVFRLNVRSRAPGEDGERVGGPPRPRDEHGLEEQTVASVAI
jgi:hypothetical protein